LSSSSARTRSAGERVSFASAFRAELREQRAAVEQAARITWPSPRYRANPVAFFREILGVEPWSKQIEIIEAVRDNPRVAVKSGHKVAKSHSAAGIALCFYCSYEDARVVMTSTTSRQVDQILWRELKMMRARAGRCVDCKKADPEGHRIPKPCPHSALIDGELGELARTGLKSVDFREIVGFTAREAEAVAGISGRNLLYIVDEASGVEDEIFEAIEGNRAGGARVLLLGNPTKTSGEHYEAFHAKRSFYFGITVSSEETPNVIARREVIPGLATYEWIEEKKEEWGEDSPLYRVRVKGEHAKHEDGKIFSIHMIELAEQRWFETPSTGRLFIGVDPAGASGTGDESAFACRRGLKLIALTATRGLSDDAHLVQLLGLIREHKIPRETPVVVIDREGSVGASLHGLLRQYVEANPHAFELVAVRASDRAIRQRDIYDRARDELAANLFAWVRDGGAIIEDAKLSAEMHELEWKQHVNGRLKVTPKDVLKKKLGRSPDRYDALALSCWEPLSLKEGAPPIADRGRTNDAARPALDPYAGSRAWERRR
jgi:phage terminase large subunit